MRPSGQHAIVKRAAAALGASTISLPGLRLRVREDSATRHALADALDCERMIFSSPAAVRAATRLQMPATVRKRAVAGPRTIRKPVASAKPLASIKAVTLAIGLSTARALRHAGVPSVIVPASATSEGLLALTELQHVSGKRFGLITAPGGRGLLAAALRARGANLRVAEVYTREPAKLTQRHVEALLAAAGSGALLLTSGEALANVLGALPDAARLRLFDCTVVASSDRLAEIARATGFARIVTAAGTQPRELLAALAAHAKSQRFA